MKLLHRVESLGRDVRFGLRMLRKDAVVSLAAVVSLGLAIGACTVVRSVLGGVALAVGLGLAGGLGGGMYFARFVEALLFEIEPISPSSLAVPVLCLVGVGLLAAWLPARRATRVDPVEALRMD